MDVRPLVIHVLDAVLGLVVLHAGARHLAAHPPRLAAGEGFARRLFTEDPAVIFGPDPVVVEAADAGNRTLTYRQAIGLKLGEPRPKARVDIAFEHLRRRVDMSVGIVHAKPVLHACFSLFGAHPRRIIGSQGTVVVSYVVRGISKGERPG